MSKKDEKDPAEIQEAQKPAEQTLATGNEMSEATIRRALAQATPEQIAEATGTAAPLLDPEMIRRALAQASLDQLTKAAQARAAENRPDPFPETGPGRFRCVRKCHHQVPGAAPGHARLWLPGEILTAQEGEKVPRHFVRIDDPAGEEAARKAMAENERMEVPGFVKEGKKIEIGG